MSDAIKARVREGSGTYEAVRDVLVAIAIEGDDYEDYALSVVTERDTNHTSTDFIDTLDALTLENYTKGFLDELCDAWCWG